jgi:hypothetical protein
MLFLELPGWKRRIIDTEGCLRVSVLDCLRCSPTCSLFCRWFARECPAG